MSEKFENSADAVPIPYNLTELMKELHPDKVVVQNLSDDIKQKRNDTSRVSIAIRKFNNDRGFFPRNWKDALGEEQSVPEQFVFIREVNGSPEVEVTYSFNNPRSFVMAAALFHGLNENANIAEREQRQEKIREEARILREERSKAKDARQEGVYKAPVQETPKPAPGRTDGKPNLFRK